MRGRLLAWRSLLAVAAFVVTTGIATATTPIGTFHRDFYDLLGRRVPLPPGEFEAISSIDFTLGQVKAAAVALGQIKNKKLQAMAFVIASAKEDKMGVGTRADVMCARTDVFDKTVVSNEDFGPEDCLVISHTDPQDFRNPRASVPLRLFAAALDKRGIPLPPALATAYFSIADRDGFLKVVYSFNPETRRIESHPAASWAESDWHKNFIARDPKKVAYMKSLRTWASAWWPYVRQGFSGDLQIAPPATLSATFP